MGVAALKIGKNGPFGITPKDERVKTHLILISKTHPVIMQSLVKLLGFGEKWGIDRKNIFWACSLSEY